MNGFQMNGRVVGMLQNRERVSRILKILSSDPQKQSIVVELLLMKKTQARLQQRCVSVGSGMMNDDNNDLWQDNIKKMLEKADKLGRHGVSTGTIKSFFNAHTDDQYQAAMKQLDGNDKS